jgi:hypothetical protein
VPWAGTQVLAPDQLAKKDAKVTQGIKESSASTDRTDRADVEV